MTAMTAREAAEVTRVLQELLEAAEVPSSEGGPVTLVSSSFDETLLEEVCVVKSRYSDAEERIKEKLADGFKVVHMAIVRVWGGGPGMEHTVLTVLVKLKSS